jgi:molecular chaperone GrpE (heat shock protein)
MTDEVPINPADSSPAATDPREPAADQNAGEIAGLKRERDELHDRLLRKTAEFDN